MADFLKSKLPGNMKKTGIYLFWQKCALHEENKILVKKKIEGG